MSEKKSILARLDEEEPSEVIDDAMAEITKLTSQLEEARAALRKVVEAKMPGEARSIARSVLEASNKEGGKS